MSSACDRFIFGGVLIGATVAVGAAWTLPSALSVGVQLGSGAGSAPSSVTMAVFASTDPSFFFFFLRSSDPPESALPSDRIAEEIWSRRTHHH
jgi:hypothetical protein